MLIFNDVLPNESQRQRWTTQSGYAKCHSNYPSLFALNAEVNICTTLCPLDPSIPSFAYILFLTSAKWPNITHSLVACIHVCLFKQGSVMGFNAYVFKGHISPKVNEKKVG